MMASASARQVADFILAFCNHHGDLISNLKLQKLLYYAQAWNLAIADQPLFDDPLEAWIHGPVQPAVYQDFKVHGAGPIQYPAKAPNIGSNAVKHVIEVMKVYGGMSAFELERRTHNEEPWQLARNGLPPDAPSHAVIRQEWMRDYYKTVLKLHGQT